MITLGQTEATAATPPPTWTSRVVRTMPPARLPQTMIDLPGVSTKCRDIVGHGRDNEYVADVTIWNGGKYVEIKMVHLPRREEAKGEAETAGQKAQPELTTQEDGRRRRPTALARFSPTSQKGLRVKLAKIDRRRAPFNRWLLITLTCGLPLKRPFGVLEDVFESFKRKVGRDVVIVWRAQLQARGVIHYHLLVYIPGAGPLTTHERDLVNAALITRWSDRVSRETGAPATAIDVKSFDNAQSMEKAMSYISSSAQDAAADQNGNVTRLTGRRWGVLGRRAYKSITTPVTYRLDDVDTAFRLRRHLRRARRAEMRSWRRPRTYRAARRSVDLRIFVSAVVARRLLAAEVWRARRIARRYGLPPPMRRR